MAQRQTILCVDDMDRNLELRKQILEVKGYHVFTALDPRSALQTIWNHKIDLAILDFHLGGPTNGVHLARDIRTVCPDLPIIMLTGDPQIRDREHDAVSAWVIKGDPVHILPDTIKQLLDQPSKALPVAPN
jgi:CheY-like chemotaxis protein